MYFERTLRKEGVNNKMKKEGIQEHDTVDVCGFEFEYVY